MHVTSVGFALTQKSHPSPMPKAQNSALSFVSFFQMKFEVILSAITEWMIRTKAPPGGSSRAGVMVFFWKLPDCISWSVTSSKAARFRSGRTTSSWLLMFLSTRCRIFSLHRASHSSSAGVSKHKDSRFSCYLLRSVCCQLVT